MALDVADRYLHLMKQCLTRLVFLDEEVREVGDLSDLGWADSEQQLVAAALSRDGLRLVRPTGSRSAREIGRDWPPPARAETMIGLPRLDNIQACVTDAVRQGVPGDLIEAGAWRGGAAIFIRAVLAAMGDDTRRVWVADSFEGLPKADASRYPADAGLEFFADISELSVDLETVKANFARYGLLDDAVVFLPGWFNETLPNAPLDHLAVIRVDGDLYESTMDALSALYPRLSIGGYVIIDDYNDIRACRRAVSDYRVTSGITDMIRPIDWTGVYWQKTG